ncbi:FAD-binding oxidoreductase [Alcaligenaceae bacterium]|nr:FAD-binding oxidoreductase [Alcaligenaceae bacterium]
MAVAYSWGRLSACEHTPVLLSGCQQAASEIARGVPAGKGLPYGMGRSYGDVCLNPGGVLWHTRGMDRYLAFDEDTGLLECEAGVLLRDIQALMVPRGWMLPVVPGTQLITVGGAIANDVHGKNHHVFGTFGDNVAALTLVRTTGETIECGRDRNPEWLAATIGGLGLTGLISKATLRLRRVDGPWLDTEIVPFDGLSDFFNLADTSEAGWEHTVAWIDCLSGSGRGIFMRANHARRSDWRSVKPGRLSVPFVPPVSLVNGLTLRPFNTAYFHLQARKAGRSTVHFLPFFHPLDGIGHWNRIYGPKGFHQYQCVVPREDGERLMGQILREISRSGQGSFLAVLKTFGSMPPAGLLSFCRPGVTLALDFPVQPARNAALFQRLDALVREAGGRLYPAKDSRMSAEMFAAGYPRLEEFSAWRDPGISSSMSRRLTGK